MGRRMIRRKKEDEKEKDPKSKTITVKFGETYVKKIPLLINDKLHLSNATTVDFKNLHEI